MADEPPSLTLVLDTGPIVALDRLGYADSLVTGAIGTAVIPAAVALELESGAPRPGARLGDRLQVLHTPEAVLETFVREYDVARSVHAGELAVIALTRALRDRGAGRDARAVLDDLPARRLAVRAGLTPSVALTGTLGLLIVIHDAGLGAASLPEEIAHLQRSGYRFSPALVQRALDMRPHLREAGSSRRSIRRLGQPVPHVRPRPAPESRPRSIK